MKMRAPNLEKYVDITKLVLSFYETHNRLCVCPGCCELRTKANEYLVINKYSLGGPKERWFLDNNLVDAKRILEIYRAHERKKIRKNESDPYKSRYRYSL